MESENQQNTISEMARLMGSKGGVSTLNRHGKEHYKKMIEKRWATWRQKKAKQEQILSRYDR